MTPSTEFLSCDWGTTSFRLRRVERGGVSVIREMRTAEGVKDVHGRAVEAGLNPGSPAWGEVFAAVLARGIRGLADAGAPVPTGVPVVISGMASSTLGWKEVPYATIPCGLDGVGLGVEAMDPVSVDGSVHPVWLVSGLCTASDMMRGEESELMGVLALPEFSAARGGCVVVLPGTHAKHVRVGHGSILDVRTYMTGELLEVLSTQTLFRVSVVWPPPVLLPGADGAAQRDELKAGVAAVRALGLARALFQVRVRSVLRRVEPGANAWFLVGLVMGAEVLDLLEWDVAGPVVLAGAASFSEGYRVVFEALGALERLTVVPPDRLRDATIRAHALVLERLGR